MHDVGKCKVGVIVCYDAMYPEVARILTLKGAEVLLMPSAGRSGPWTEDTEEAVARRAKDQLSLYRFRAVENGVFAVITNQAGAAGTVEFYRPRYRRQPYHAGGTLVFAPDGALLAESQTRKIEADMAVADLTAESLCQGPGQYQLYPAQTPPRSVPELLRPVTRD